MKGWIIGAAAACLLAGCASAAEQLAADQAKCDEYGFQRGTDAYSNCLMRLDQERRLAPRMSFGVGVGTRF